MVIFSVMQRSHRFPPLEKACALALIDHLMVKGVSWSFSFHICSDKVVTFSLVGLFLMVALWPLNRCLNVFLVIPVYVIVLFFVVICA